MVLAPGDSVTIVPLSLATRSNQTRYGFEGAARLINCYAEELGGDAKQPLAVYPIEGLDAWITPAYGEVKCLLETESYLYGVTQSGDAATVWAVNASDVVTVIATLDAADSWYIARNRRSPTTQVGLVASTGLYYVIETTTLTQVTDADLPPPTSITVRDGYFILPTTFGRFFITGEDDASSISALDFGKAQRNPDSILRAVASETDVVLMGQRSIEWHQNAPGATESFPFVPVAQIELGLAGADAVAKLDRTIIWVANDGTVRRMNGYGGDVISTSAVERAIGSVDVSTIRACAWTVRDAGKSFFQIKTPSWCWVYDIDGGTGWHERSSYGSDTYRVSAAAEWQGYTILGDDTTGVLYRASRNTYSEAGQPIVMTVQAPPVDATPHPLTVNALYVDVVPGQGLTTTPALMMSYSDDGGRNWATERSASMGRFGQTLTRCKFTRLGMIRRNGRTFRLSASASTARGMIAAFLDVTKEAAG